MARGPTESRTRVPDAIDVEVGHRLKMLRGERGLTQSQMARALGVSFQQVQKYESGANRLSASTLLRAAEVLGASLTSLYGEAGARVVSDPRVPAPELEAMIEAWTRLAKTGNRRAVIRLAWDLRRVEEEHYDTTDSVMSAADAIVQQGPAHPVVKRRRRVRPARVRPT